MRTKVVTLVDRLGDPGGGETFAAYLAGTLDSDAFESVLCVSRPSAPERIAALRAAGVRVLELNRSSRLSLLSWLSLVRFLRRERVDVLHSHKFGSNVWAALLRGVGGVPVLVAHEHSWSFRGDPVRLLLDRRLVGRRADAIVAVSALDRARIVERERVDPTRVVLQPNGIPALPRPPDGALRRELGCYAGERLVGIVARLTPEKRVDLFLEALARLPLAKHTVRGVVIGDGPEKQALRRLARERGLDPFVVFLGRRDDVPALVTDLDVAVLCSDREGCPLTLLEYMALGRPVVATRVGGVPDLARDGREALLVEPGDPAALARAIGELLDDPARAARLGASAAQRQEEEFRLEPVARRFEDLYLRLLERRPRPSVSSAAAEPQPGVRL